MVGLRKWVKGDYGASGLWGLRVMGFKCYGVLGFVFAVWGFEVIAFEDYKVSGLWNVRVMEF